MSALRIRCSAIGRLMTEPKSKAEGPLSVGAKTAIREIAAQDIYGVDFEIGDKKIEKGRMVEAECIELVNRVHGLSLTKNSERRHNEWITGECDVFDAQRRAGRDIKAAWSVQTFPICKEDIAEAQRKLYEWQFRGYMWLWDADEWHGDYCLVDTPEKLIGYEPLPLHVVRHIAEHLRVTTWTVKRDAELERQMAEKVKAARDYYAEVIAEFERSHPEPGATALPWEESPAAIAASARAARVFADPFTAPPLVPAPAAAPNLEPSF